MNKDREVTYCRYVISCVLSVVQVMLDSMDRMDTGRPLPEAAEVVRLTEEVT